MRLSLNLFFLYHFIHARSLLTNTLSTKLPISRRLNLTSVHNLLRHDQARAKALRTRHSHTKLGDIALNRNFRSFINEPVDNQAVTYIATIGVGNPATNFKLLIDTGSSNTWVGATEKYQRTSTSALTLNTVQVTYGSGSFTGTEYTDQVTIAPSLALRQQSIGVATTSQGFLGVDGILGIGPQALTIGTLFPAITQAIPTVTDNAFTAGQIPMNVLGIYFQPTADAEAMNGELNWGGLDDTKFTGSMNYVPITSTEPSSKYWGIDQSIAYGTDITVLARTSGILDTGTTLILLASKAFKSYQKATGGILDTKTGLLKISSTQFKALKSLFFKMNGVSYELTPNAQIWPRTLNSEIGGGPNDIYLVVNDLGSNGGKGLDFICGYAFLERFYTVYDTTERRIGIATTQFTTATIN